MNIYFEKVDIENNCITNAIQRLLFQKLTKIYFK